MQYLNTNVERRSHTIWYDDQREVLNLRLTVAEFRRSTETTCWGESYSSLGAWGEQWYIDMIMETNKSYLEFLGMDIGK